MISFAGKMKTKQGVMRKLFTAALLMVAAVAVAQDSQQIAVSDSVARPVFREISRPTPNFDADKVNEVRGVVLHHTAEPTAERSVEILTSPARKVSSHVVIDTDGTRYVLAQPTTVAYHAGYSTLGGRDACNEFTIGIEFQGNTLVEPLTDLQIESAIEYLLPIIRKYDIPEENIVTHEAVRNNYKRKYPYKKISGKVDITPAEYQRFMERLRKIAF